MLTASLSQVGSRGMLLQPGMFAAALGRVRRPLRDGGGGLVGIRAFHAIGIHGHDHIIIGCTGLYTRVSECSPGNETAVQDCGVRSARHSAAINVVSGDG